ncbi:hypothetical protein F2Q69_00048779 [Brassica cretica]|uniref:Translation initiation factor 3 N-terminal domain-containing protein n=1 Tax=Brassica cretica TaxID=69181 RepID=A0A8S9Q0M8_BRACR|nr:hypothetical protein F2Q69_00048779 [Brassica cretica]
MNEDIQKEDHREDSSPTKQLEHEKDKDQATVSTELEEVRVVETEQTLILGKGSEEDKNDEGNKVALKETEWSDVTPGKASRSPKKINSEVEQSLIISNSRFSVLALTDEDGEEEEMVVQRIQEFLIKRKHHASSHDKRRGYCIVSLTEALRWAKELKHDLVEVQRDANPPGVKLQTTPMRSTKRLK